MLLEEMRTTGYQAPRRRVCAPDGPPRAQPFTCKRVGVSMRLTLSMSLDYPRGQGIVVTGVTAETVVPFSSTLRKSADVTFRTNLDERQLRPTVGARPDEVLVGSPARLQSCIAGDAAHNLGRYRGDL